MIRKFLLKLDLWWCWWAGIVFGGGMIELFPSYEEWKVYVDTTLDRTEGS